MTEWQPIATAPKHRPVLAGYWNPQGKWRTIIAQWRDDLPQHDDAEADDEPAPPGWYEGSMDAEMMWMTFPSYWQPLPEPPTYPERAP